MRKCTVSYMCSLSLEPGAIRVPHGLKFQVLVLVHIDRMATGQVRTQGSCLKLPLAVWQWLWDGKCLLTETLTENHSVCCHVTLSEQIHLHNALMTGEKIGKIAFWKGKGWKHEHLGKFQVHCLFFCTPPLVCLSMGGCALHLAKDHESTPTHPSNNEEHSHLQNTCK